jgi:hypothetical protein
MTGTQVETSQDVATTKEKSDLLVNIISENNAKLLDWQFKSITAMLVGLGWLMSSEVTQKLIGSWFMFPVGFTASIAILGYIYVSWVASIFNESKDSMNSLLVLGYMPRDIIQKRSVKRSHVISLCAVQIVLYLGIVGFAWAVYAKGR